MRSARGLLACTLGTATCSSQWTIVTLANMNNHVREHDTHIIWDTSCSYSVHRQFAANFTVLVLSPLESRAHSTRLK